MGCFSITAGLGEELANANLKSKWMITVPYLIKVYPIALPKHLLSCGLILRTLTLAVIHRALGSWGLLMPLMVTTIVTVIRVLFYFQWLFWCLWRFQTILLLSFFLSFLFGNLGD
ncbi:MAG: hypothetical protein QS721_11895 [Candidatus Endonucleobacter sp. (ex Gigantidas childressi)]|nr:hypothetical protein [Candidatus Endonucleobacter sp. (ex Gigantidas childressi)]